ncbi:MAG: hypothetical protein WD512_06715 [Candidatus Paceibacterota bacterium]
MRILCKCINDKNRPKEIPVSKWVKLEEEYNVIHVSTSLHENSKNVLMFTLAELDISDCEPYAAFRASRFAIHKDDLEKLEELARLCTELNDVDISILTKELETV